MIPLNNNDTHGKVIPWRVTGVLVSGDLNSLLLYHIMLFM